MVTFNLGVTSGQMQPSVILPSLEDDDFVSWGGQETQTWFPEVASANFDWHTMARCPFLLQFFILTTFPGLCICHYNVKIFHITCSNSVAPYTSFALAGM